MNRYYFTFGTSRKFPFRGGWVEVVAPDRKTAVRVFRSKYPDVNEGVVNCSDIYTADQFSKTGMVDGNLGGWLSRHPALSGGVSLYEFRNVKGHIEVFLNGEFQFSADTMKEAKDELNAD